MGFKLSIGGYTLTQSAMLFLKYGMEYDMPNWVVYFPSIVLGVILAIIVLVLLIGLIATIWS